MPDTTKKFFHPKDILLKLNLNHNMQIADFGAGTGHFALEIARMFGNETPGQIYAVEIQKTFLKELKSKAETENLTSIKYQWADIEMENGSRLLDNSMDYVFIINTLFQLDGKEQAIREARRILKPDAHLLIIDWKKFEQKFGADMEKALDPNEIDTLCEKLGFVKEKELQVSDYHWGRIYTKK